jgi:superfamily II DNA or RNA helicase
MQLKKVLTTDAHGLTRIKTGFVRNQLTHRSELSRALKRESGDQISATTTFFDLEPKDYQKDMLEQLALEREHNRFRNLVVAATGTGKTVIAAFDYRAASHAIGGRPRLLFVAHRKEILTQARRTYCEVLRDRSFGELLADGADLQNYDHVFATIDSVCAREIVAKCGPQYWHMKFLGSIRGFRTSASA